MQVRCPHCNSSIDLSSHGDLTKIACPSCGSTFNLVPDTEPYLKSLKKLGRFELIEAVGGGGFGTVYKARDTELERTVAVKVPRLDRLHGLESELFLREARAAAPLRHPNIAAIHEIGREDEFIYIVSDFIPGVTLANWLTASRLSAREAAEMIAQIADALEHAHKAGIIHRDLKPSNIMLDGERKPHVIDFGLARQEAGQVTMTLGGRRLGTLLYMSPEQADAKTAGPPSDIYSLGVVLFELLTGELPFRGVEEMVVYQKLHDEAPSPRKFNRRVPRDLETICLKCLERVPIKRYASAAALAADLRRFLGGEPIQARPVGPVERAYRWCQRKPVLAAWLATLVLLMTMTVLWQIGAADRRFMEANDKALRLEKAEAVAKAAEATAQASLADAKFKAGIAAEKEKAASERASERSRAANLQTVSRLHSDIEKLQRTHHYDWSQTGWSEKAWSHVAEAAQLGPDLALRNRAAANLLGFDVKMHGPRHRFPASSLAFNNSGGILLGGAPPWKDKDPDTTKETTFAAPARVLDADGSVRSLFDTGAVGLVALDAEQTPVQLIWQEDARRLELVNLSTGDIRQAFPLPELDGVRLQTTALSPTARRIAGAYAATRLENGESITEYWVAVWDDQGRELFPPIPFDATALAFSPDGELLALGSRQGVSAVWSIAEKRQLVGDLQLHRSTIHELTFGRDPWQPVDKASPLGHWLLATGDAAAAIVIWDLDSKTTRTICRGSPYHVLALDFSSDGMTLASAGRFDVRLWDIATGALLMTMSGPSTTSDIKLSPQGDRLAAGGVDDKQMFVLQVEPHRGIQTCRGLAAPIQLVTFSPDDRLLAALSHDHRVAVWDLRAGRLLHVLSAPEAAYADNAALAFSPDGHHLACSASTEETGEAALWDVQSGQEVCRWPLPPALQHALFFPTPESLVLFQSEVPDGSHLPDSSMPVSQHPRRGRFYDLAIGKSPVKRPDEITDSDRGFESSTFADDGRFLVTLSRFNTISGKEHQVCVYSPQDGVQIWADPGTANAAGNANAFALDYEGQWLTIWHGGNEPWAAFWATGSWQKKDASFIPKFNGKGWSPDSDYYTSGVESLAYPLLRLKKTAEPAVGLAIDERMNGEQKFSHDGKLFAWGGADGVVHVADIEEVRRKLNEVGLGW